MSFVKAAGKLLTSGRLLSTALVCRCGQRAFSVERNLSRISPLSLLSFGRVGFSRSHLSCRNFATEASTATTNATEATTTGKKPEQQGSKQGSSGGDKEEKKWYHAWTGKNAWKLGALSMTMSFTMVSGYILVNWGAPLVDAEGNAIVDEFSSKPIWQQYPLRAWREIMQYQQMIQDPVSDKLLPDPLQEPYFQPPYTIVIELMGVLVHPDWTYKTGWRFRKRPGLDYLLKACAYPMYEIVIFTQEPALTAHPLIDGLDPNNMVMYRLYRDSTRYARGVHIKDLSCLNRDLSKVIFIDWDAKTGQLQPRNMLRLPKWKGEEKDTTLVDLAAFLRTLALSGVDDVRPVLEYYQKFDDPLFVFRENQRKLASAEQQKASAPSSPSLLQSSLVGSTAKSWSGWRR